MSIRSWTLLFCLLNVSFAWAQEVGPPITATASEELSEKKTLPFASDREYDRLVRGLDRAIQQGDWSIVCERLLQLQAASPEDLATWRGVVSSVPLVASRLVQSLPEEGKKVYQRLAQPVAEEKLQAALKRRDLAAIEQVARQYRHTSAAGEALLLLFRQRVDLGEWEEASLMMRGHLLASSPRIARRILEKFPAATVSSNEDRLPESMQSGFPSLFADWEYLPDLPEAVRETLERTTRELRQSGQSPYPTMSLTSIPDGIVICGPSQRTALDVQTGAVRWKRPIPGYMAHWMREPGDLGDATRRRMFAISLARRVFDESVTSRTQTDGKYLYFVETIPLDDPIAKPVSDMDEPFPASRIVCAAVETGETEWVFNGVPEAEIFFTGPPAVFGNRLYVLGRSSAGLFALFTLDSSSGRPVQVVELATVYSGRLQDDLPSGHAALIEVHGGQLICASGSGVILSIDPLFGEIRWAIRLPGSESTAGTLDAAEGELKGSGFENWSGWQAVQVLHAEDMLIFTAPGTDMLTALRQTTGEIVWQIPRGKALHLAGIDGQSQLLAIEKNRARGIDLKNGRTRWIAEIPEPAGRGILSGSLYLFPILEGDFARLDLRTRTTETSFQAAFRTPHPDGVLPRKIQPRHVLSLENATFVLSVNGVRKLQSLQKALAQQGSRSPWENLLSRAERGEWEPASLDWRTMLTSSQQEHSSVRETLRALLTFAARREISPARQLHLRSQVDELVQTPLERAAWRQMQARDRAQERNWPEFVSLWLKAPQDELNILLPGDHADSRCRLDRWFQAAVRQHCQDCPPEEVDRLRSTIQKQLPRMESMDVSEQQRLRQCLGETEWGEQWGLRLPERNDDPQIWTQQQLDWLTLSRHDNPTIAAGAAERLLAASVIREQWRDADEWLKALSRAPQHLLLPSGKTPAQVVEEWADVVSLAFEKQEIDWPLRDPQLRQKTGRTQEVRLMPVPVNREAGKFFSRMNVEMDFPAHAAIRFNGSQWKRPWYQKLPRTHRNMRLEVGLDHVWTFGTFCVLQTGSEVFGINPLGQKNSARSRLLWPPRGSRVDTLGSRDNLMLSFRWAPSVQRPGFESPGSVRVDEFGHQAASVGPVRSNYFCIQQMGMLVTLETATGQECWRRYDLPQQAFVCGNDEEIAVIAPLLQTVTRYRVLDGAELGQRAWTDSLADLLQHEETSLLLEQQGLARPAIPSAPSSGSDFDQSSQEGAASDTRNAAADDGTAKASIIWKQMDVRQDRLLWQREWPPGSISFEVDQEIIGIFLPSGRVELVNVRSGQTIRTHQLPLSTAPAKIVASVAEKDVIVIFSTLDSATETPDELRMQFGYRHPYVQGVACCFRKGTGELIWQQELGPSVFRRDQPVDLPVFVTMSKPSPVHGEPDSDLETEPEQLPGVPAPPEEKGEKGVADPPVEAPEQAPENDFVPPGILLRCYDRRTGKLLRELPGEKAFYAITGDRQRGLVTLDTVKTRLEIDFSGDVEEPAEPRTDAGAAPEGPK